MTAWTCPRCGASDYYVGTQTRPGGRTNTTHTCLPCKRAAALAREKEKRLAAVAAERLPSRFFGGGGGFDRIGVYPHPLEMWEVEG